MIQITVISEANAYAEGSERNWVRREYYIESSGPIPNKDYLWEHLEKLKKEGKVHYKWALPQDILLFDDGTAVFTPYLGSMD
jgi:hypothetical protein